MAIKHSGNIRISNSLHGIFNGVTPGGSSSFPSASEGKMFWHTGNKIMYAYLGGSWRALS